MKLLPTLLLAAACGAPDYAAPPRVEAEDTWPYLGAAQIEARAPFARPLDPDRLDAELEALFEAEEPAPLGEDPDALRRDIVEALNIGFLLDHLRATPPVLEVIAAGTIGDLAWSRVVVRDPLVQDLVLEVLRPPARADAAIPAVVGLHGHYDDAETFADDYLGAELARRGYAVVAPTFRHMHCGDDERDQSGGQVHCETVPALFPYAADINRLDTVAVPHMRVEYGFSDRDTRAEMLAFFDRELAAR